MSRVSRSFLLGVGVALGAGALVLGSLNRQPVEIDLYFGDRLLVPLWIVAVVCFALGWVIPTLLGVGRWVRRHRQVVRLRRRVQELEDEVVRLRNIPLDVETRGGQPTVRRTDRFPAESTPLALPPVQRPRAMLPRPESVTAADEAEVDVEVPPDA